MLHCGLLHLDVFAHSILSSRLSSWWTPSHYPKDRSNVTFSGEPNPNTQERISIPSFVLLGAFLYHVSTMRCIRFYPNCLIRCQILPFGMWKEMVFSELTLPESQQIRPMLGLRLQWWKICSIKEFKLREGQAFKPISNPNARREQHVQDAMCCV